MNEHEKTIQRIKQVRKALDALGIKSGAILREVGDDPSRLEVVVDGKYFGIFDTNKNTFVD